MSNLATKIQDQTVTLFVLIEKISTVRITTKSGTKHDAFEIDFSTIFSNVDKVEHKTGLVPFEALEAVDCDTFGVFDGKTTGLVIASLLRQNGLLEMDKDGGLYSKKFNQFLVRSLVQKFSEENLDKLTIVANAA